MKKFLALVTVVAMLASMMTFLATGVTAADDVPAGAIAIGNASDFASIFSADLQTAAGYYVLTADITITPGKDNHYFKIFEGSTFDGNGHTITIEKDTLNGLFEILQDSDYTTAQKTTFKNINIGSEAAPEQVGEGVFLRIEDDTSTTKGINKYVNVEWDNINVYVAFKAETSNNHAAFISNNAWGEHVFKNCYVKVTSPNANTAYGSTVSGFVGRAKGGSYTFENCVADGTICANATAAGFIGKCAGEGAPTAKFTNCVNKADITTTTKGTIAGFVGNFAQANTSVTVENCVNYGDLGNVDFGNKVAGILGDGGSGQGTATIKNTMNVGTITSQPSANAAGIIFKASAPTLEGCINIGTIYGNVWSSSLVGGIATGGTDITMTNCYSFGAIYKVGADAEGIKGYAPIAKGAGATVKSASGNRYLASDAGTGVSTETIDTSATTVATLAEALELLKATEFGKTMNFMTDGDKLVVEQVALEGIQMSKDKTSIRLLGTLESLDYASVSFEYKVTAAGTVLANGSKGITKAYGSVLAEAAEGGLETVTAADLGGAYIVALVINGVQAGDVIEITLIAGETRTATYTITVGANGALSW